MRDSSIPCAVIGTSGYSYQLISRIAMLPRALRLIGVTSLNPGEEGAAFVRAQGAQVVESLLDLLGLGKPAETVIFNPTPIPLHFGTTMQCLERGFQVALEKPPVPTLEELDDLILASKKRSAPVSVGFNYLYPEAFRQTREALQSGILGPVRRLKAIAAWQRPRSYYHQSASRGRVKSLDGEWLFDGALGNPLSHLLAMLLSLASDGAEEMASLESLQAELYRGRDYITADDTASLRIRTTGGIELLLNITIAAMDEIAPLIEIEGEQGSAVIRDFDRISILPDRFPARHLHSHRESRLIMLEEIAASRRQNRDPLITLKDCRPFTQSINAAYRSSVEIPLVPAHLRIRKMIGGEVFDGILGIEKDLEEAHFTGGLLSETSCAWARAISSSSRQEAIAV